MHTHVALNVLKNKFWHCGQQMSFGIPEDSCAYGSLGNRKLLTFVVEPSRAHSCSIPPLLYHILPVPPHWVFQIPLWVLWDTWLATVLIQELQWSLSWFPCTLYLYTGWQLHLLQYSCEWRRIHHGELRGLYWQYLLLFGFGTMLWFSKIAWNFQFWWYEQIQLTVCRLSGSRFSGRFSWW